MTTSIRTRYNGTLFRSKLEADWARLFDALGVEWQYEHEGAYWGDVFYLPDFYLPRSRQYVEVKGQWTPDDCRKVGALLHHVPPRRFTGCITECPDIPLIACNPDGKFWGYKRAGRPIMDLATLLLDHNVVVSLGQCRECDGWWFFEDASSWRCQCCGAYDGKKLLADALSSPIRPWPIIGKVA